MPYAFPANTTYPGESGNTTVALSSLHTRLVRYYTGGGNVDDNADVVATIQVVSDQPITVGTNRMGSGQHIVPCSLLPK